LSGTSANLRTDRDGKGFRMPANTGRAAWQGPAYVERTRCAGWVPSLEVIIPVVSWRVV